jgi:hypothetical protein
MGAVCLKIQPELAKIRGFGQSGGGFLKTSPERRSLLFFI